MDTRTLTAAERSLFTHVTMFGAEGYPVRKLRSGWTWGTDEVKGPPTIFRTKRAAVASFEAFLGILREALGAEAQARAIADLKARGYTEADIERAIAQAYAEAR